VYCNQHCFICRPSDSTVLEGARIVPMQDNCQQIINDEMDHFEEKFGKIIQIFYRLIRIWVQWNFSGSGFGSDLAQKFRIWIHNPAKPTVLFFLSLEMASSLTPDENRIGAVTLVIFLIFFSSGEECFLVYKRCWL
jgi:hypothetical protein